MYCQPYVPCSWRFTQCQLYILLAVLILSVNNQKKWTQMFTCGKVLLGVCHLQVTDEVRPLQQGSDLEVADLLGVQAEQLDCCTCIADYCGIQSQTYDMLNEAIIQAKFSHFDSESVLSSWPAEVVSSFKRTSVIELPEQNQSLSAES